MERAQILLRFHDEAVLVLLGELSRGPYDVVDKLGQIHRLGIDFELAGFDLREVSISDGAASINCGYNFSLRTLKALTG